MARDNRKKEPPIGLRERLKYAAGFLAFAAAVGLAVFNAWGRVVTDSSSPSGVLKTNALGGNLSTGIEIGSLLAFAGAALGIAAYERRKTRTEPAEGEDEDAPNA